MKQVKKILPKIILFGCGKIGKEALDFIDVENVAFFIDNSVSTEDTITKWGIKVLSFEQYQHICSDYITIITANSKNEVQIAQQLLSHNIRRFFFIEEISKIFNPENEIPFEIPEVCEKDLNWKESKMREIKSLISLKQDIHSEVEFYLIDSFEISHFLPLYRALKEKNIHVRFVAEPPLINSAREWFDYQNAITILQKHKISYCTLRNPNTKLAFTTQFAENLRYYCKDKCQIAYGVAVMKEKAFQLKKEVAEKFNYIFVHGDFQKDILSNWISPSHIVDMSYPRYLETFETQISKKDIINELQIKTDKPIIVYYPTWDEYSSIEKYEKAIHSLKKEFFIVSKPHHCLWHFKEKLEALYRCSDLILNENYNLYKTTKIADCALCDAKSGVVTELAFLNPEIPMVLIYQNSENTDFYVNLRTFGGIVQKPSELLTTIYNARKSVSQNTARKEIINKLFSSDIREGIKRFMTTIDTILTDTSNDHEIKPYKIASQDIWNISPSKRDCILKLDWNEATIMPSPKIKRELIKLISDEEFYQFYPAVYNEELTNALATYAQVSPECIQYFVGSDTLHEYIIRCFIEKRDKILIVWPSYDNFRYVAEVAGADVTYFYLDKSFQLDSDKFTDTIKYETPKIIYICNPNNPTGTFLNPFIIEKWIKAFPDSMFIIDEAYSEFAGDSMNRFAEKYENLLITHTLSKAFGLANFRFGYLVASSHNIKKISNIRNPKNISTVSQVAALAALRDIEYMKNYVAEVNRAKTWLFTKLRAMEYSHLFKIYDSHANFFIMKFPDNKLKEFVQKKLEHYLIYVRDLVQGYPVENSLRITIGTRAQMEIFYTNFKKIISTVKEKKTND